MGALMRIDRTHERAKYCDVYFNGEKHPRTFIADTDEGWIVEAVPRRSGEPFRPAILEPPGAGEWELNGIVVRRAYGDVRLVFRDEHGGI